MCDRIYYVPEIGLGFAYASFDGASGVGLDSEFKFGAFEIPPFFQMEPFAESHVARLYHAVVPGENATSNDVAFQIGINPTVGFKFYF